MLIDLQTPPAGPVSSEGHQRAADEVHVRVGQDVLPDTDNLAAAVVLARVHQNFAITVHSALASRSEQRVNLLSVPSKKKLTHQRSSQTSQTRAAEEVCGLRRRDGRLDKEVHDSSRAHDRTAEHAPEQTQGSDTTVRSGRHLFERQNADGGSLGENAELRCQCVAQARREVENGAVDERTRCTITENCGDGVVLMSARNNLKSSGRVVLDLLTET